MFRIAFRVRLASSDNDAYRLLLSCLEFIMLYSFERAYCWLLLGLRHPMRLPRRPWRARSFAERFAVGARNVQKETKETHIQTKHER